MATPEIKVSKGDKMTEAASGLKGLVGKRVTKKVKFMGEDIEIGKLNVSHVKEIQAIARQLDGASTDEEKEEINFNLIRYTVRAAVSGGDALEDDDFSLFPMDELSNLMDQVFKFSGLGAEKGK